MTFTMIYLTVILTVLLIVMLLKGDNPLVLEFVSMAYMIPTYIIIAIGAIFVRIFLEIKELITKKKEEVE